MSAQIILDLIDRVESLERKLRNLIRVGNVSEIQGRKCVIDFDSGGDDEYTTDLIPWLPTCAGDVLNWRPPSLDEQMIVINLSGGEDETSCVALSSMYCDDYAPSSTSQDMTYTTFNDVFEVKTDKDGNHTLTAKGNISIKSGQAFSIDAGTTISVKAADSTTLSSGANTIVKGQNVMIN